jgi:uncharacterized protein (DUF952 family)
MTDSLVFKIVEAEAWDRAVAAGRFDGAAIDLADGFIHLSAADQVAETARRHFAGRDGLVLVAVPETALGSALRWEESRGGALFPHLYGPLAPGLVAWVRPMPLGPDGVHRIPPLDGSSDGAPGGGPNVDRHGGSGAADG